MYPARIFTLPQAIFTTMIKEIRAHYNKNFTAAAYQKMLDWMVEQCGEAPRFHVAETPVFLPATLKQRLLEAAADVTKVVAQPGFAARAAAALPPGLAVLRRDDKPLFLQVDFALCYDAQGSVVPQLIEAQGFPSLYYFQNLLHTGYRTFFNLPPGYQTFFNGYSSESYLALLKQCILAEEDPAHVIL
ncbi:MAG: hypothetical protein HC821_04545, partial [Lewinella sp.]|nr:hypothetical protein [Lewinella sp.]